MKVAFQGEHGAYSEAALLKHFGEGTETLPCASFDELFAAVESGRAEAAVVPIENSLAGSVLDNYDLLLQDQLPIVGAPPNMQLDGMLGAPWFGGRTWEWDYRAGTLRILPTGALPKADAAHVVKLGVQLGDSGVQTTHFMRLPARVDGTELQFLFDTGATFRLDEAAAAELGDAAVRERAGSFITTTVMQEWRTKHPDWPYLAQGDGKAAMIRVPEVEVAGFRTGPVWFSARPDAAFHQYMAQWMDRPVDGALGGNAFAGMRITVDYPSATAVFER